MLSATIFLSIFEFRICIPNKNCTHKDDQLHMNNLLLQFLKITDLSKENYIILLNVWLEGHLRLAGV